MELVRNLVPQRARRSDLLTHLLDTPFLVRARKDHIVGLEAPYKGDLGQFLRNPDGSIAWLRLGTRIHRPL